MQKYRHIKWNYIVPQIQLALYSPAIINSAIFISYFYSIYLASPFGALSTFFNFWRLSRPCLFVNNISPGSHYTGHWPSSSKLNETATFYSMAGSFKHKIKLIIKELVAKCLHGGGGGGFVGKLLCKNGAYAIT